MDGRIPASQPVGNLDHRHQKRESQCDRRGMRVPEELVKRAKNYKSADDGDEEPYGSRPGLATGDEDCNYRDETRGEQKYSLRNRADEVDDTHANGEQRLSG